MLPYIFLDPDDLDLSGRESINFFKMQKQPGSGNDKPGKEMEKSTFGVPKSILSYIRIYLNMLEPI